MEDRKFNNKTSIRVVGSSKYGYTVIPNNVMNDMKNMGGNFCVWFREIMRLI